MHASLFSFSLEFVYILVCTVGVSDEIPATQQTISNSTSYDKGQPTLGVALISCGVTAEAVGPSYPSLASTKNLERRPMMAKHISLSMRDILCINISCSRTLRRYFTLHAACSGQSLYPRSLTLNGCRMTHRDMIRSK